MAISFSRILSFFGLLKGPDVPLATDRPVPFGYKTTWLTVRSDSSEAVSKALGLTKTSSATWVGGVSKSSGKTWVFVTPSDAKVEHLHSLLHRLSLTFGEAQYFGSSRVVGYVAWFKSVAGETVRAFSYADGTLFANQGDTTEAERALGYPDMAGLDARAIWDALDETDARMDEEDPMRIAERWSVNPLHLDQKDADGPGIVGVMDLAKAAHSA